MSDRPILFSASMVRALPDGRKTQTRRVFKGIEQTDSGDWHIFGGGGGTYGVEEESVSRLAPDYVPYAAGDRLWVREAWRTAAHLDRFKPSHLPVDSPIFYEADAGGEPVGATGRKRPGMFMPRWASRLTLIVTDVRVQRVQDISRDDAIAEGLTLASNEIEEFWRWPEPYEEHLWLSPCKGAYRWLWDALNAKRAPWASNPWVVALTFRTILGNIDQVTE